MIQIHAQKSVAFKTDDESPLPQWIGAITDERTFRVTAIM